MIAAEQCSSPSPLGSPIALELEDDGMEFSPILESISMPAEDAPLSSSAPTSLPSGLSLDARLRSSILADVEAPPASTRDFATHDAALSPIMGAMTFPTHDVEELSPILGGMLLPSGEDLVEPAREIPSADVLDPPDGNRPPGRAIPPDGNRPPGRAIPPDTPAPPARAPVGLRPSAQFSVDDVRDASQSTPTPGVPQGSHRTAADATTSASSISPRPRVSADGSPAAPFVEGSHAQVLNGVMLLNQHSAHHLGFLQVERAAWNSALEACRGYQMHCATIDWSQWCLYNDHLERMAER